MIFDMVIYVSLINLTKTKFIILLLLATTKELSIPLLMCFRIFNFGQIKTIFCGDENFKKINTTTKLS